MIHGYSWNSMDIFYGYPLWISSMESKSNICRSEFERIRSVHRIEHLRVIHLKTVFSGSGTAVRST